MHGDAQLFEPKGKIKANMPIVNFLISPVISIGDGSIGSFDALALRNVS